MTAPIEYREPEKYALDRPEVVRRVYHIVIAVCMVLGMIDVVNLALHWIHYHPHFSVEHVPNFYGFYGFGGCVFLVLAAKQLRKVVMRDEDYYNNDVD
jgi:hypothetical protein